MLAVADQAAARADSARPDRCCVPTCTTRLCDVGSVAASTRPRDAHASVASRRRRPCRRRTPGSSSRRANDRAWTRRWRRCPGDRACAGNPRNAPGCCRPSSPPLHALVRDSSEMPAISQSGCAWKSRRCRVPIRPMPMNPTRTRSLAPSTRRLDAAVASGCRGQSLEKRAACRHDKTSFRRRRSGCCPRARDTGAQQRVRFVVADNLAARVIPGERPSELLRQIRQDAGRRRHVALLDVRHRLARAFRCTARKFFMCPRIAGATCFSRSFSVLSSGNWSSS